ncbi:nucleoside hydrolase [Hoeflea prorocentri]|uniref:Nucleoside hydrolase n=1 Tax=Hoeflea prorocentri TaxID=1922333 RepID=A0A9X3UJC7_9HYPH|nr:nucleoside hydrolase [Hoeflea prorocentri]MCY6379806.1 nucleoside hydrolase [Hoeflea prorocentri]MDA5397606.1 nucleoside hydrolase [Hoeflea prorocentri]
MSRFSKLPEDLMRERLALPGGDRPVRLLIDTDAANEIDDQYAIAWALLSPEKMTVEAVTAEPFSFAHHRPELIAAERAIEEGTQKSEHLVGGFQGWIHRLHAQGRRAEDVEFVGPAEGMELSYQEILTVYEKLAIPSAGKVFRGADRYMSAADEPVPSEAVDTIIDLAKSGDDPLYIAAMGCVTNIASALLRAPEIMERVIVIWTSSYPSTAPHSNRPSLNLFQDLHASRLLFDCGVPHIYLPGYHVGAQLKISHPEMEKFVKGRGAIGDYLWHLYTHNPLHRMFALTNTEQRTWVIWDIINIAWLVDPQWVPTHLTTSPILDESLHWRHDPSRHMMREAHDVQRDEIFLDLFRKLEKAAGK